MKKITMKRLFAMLLAVVMLVGILPVTSAAKQSLITAYFSTGKIETPPAPYIVDKTDGGDTFLTIYVEQPSDLQQLALDAQQVGESALLVDTYGLAWFSKFLQIDAKFNDGPWLSAEGDWDKVNEYNEQDYGVGVDPRDYCFLMESTENADNADKLISFTQSWLAYYDPAEPVNDFYVPFVKTRLNEYGEPDYYFDLSETTITYRVRWCVRYIEDQYTEDERWTVVTSDWSPEASIGKNGNQQPLTMPTSLDAPVLSDFSYVVTDGFSDTKCFVEIPDSVYAAEKYLLAMEDAFEPFILDFQVKINDGDWQQGNTANATTLTNGFRTVGIDDPPGIPQSTDDVWVRLRIRSSSNEGGLSSPWSNVVGTKPLVTENEDVTLNVTVNGGGGKVTFDGATFYDNYTGSYAYGADPTVIFAPDYGYELDKVTVNGVETGVLSNVLTVLMDGNKNVVVTFKPVDAVANPYTITIPLEKIVVAGSQTTVPARTFVFEMFDWGYSFFDTEYPTITGDAIVTNGAGTYPGTLTLSVDSEDEYYNLTEGFYLREKVATAEGWEYSDAVYHVYPDWEDNESWKIFPTEKFVIEGETFFETLSDPVEKASFTNTYTYYPADATPAPNPDSPSGKYLLNVTVNGGNGKVSPDGFNFFDQYQESHDPGEEPLIIFAPDEGYELDKVTVNGVETGVLSNVLNVLMNDNKDVVATFKKLPQQIVLPLEKIVAKGGDLEPHAQQFTFELFGFGVDGLTEADLNIAGNMISTSGANTYTGNLVITVDDEMFGNLTEGFYLREKQATVDGWTYSDAVYEVLYYQADDSTQPVWLMFPTAKHEIDNEIRYERLGDPVEKAIFINTYTKNKGEDGPTLFTLTYETNGGTAYPAESYAPDTVVVLDKTPTREGYNFTGWYSDKGAVNKITSVKMDADKTVYAGWEFIGDLNAKDHVAYVKGYPDGTVGPERNVTRAETAVMLYRLLTPERSAEITTTENSFTDVTAAEWYNKEVSSMAKGEYIKGYEDGSFGGDKSITRAEFVTMMVRFINPAPGTKTFTDVPASHWAYSYISTATAASWIDGYEDGSFGPDKPITRAEAMTIINRVLNRGVDKDSDLLDFKKWPDNNPTDWFYYDIIEATNSHEYVGSRPSEDWTKILK